MPCDEHACWLVAPANAILQVKEPTWREGGYLRSKRSKMSRRIPPREQVELKMKPPIWAVSRPKLLMRPASVLTAVSKPKAKKRKPSTPSTMRK